MALDFKTDAISYTEMRQKLAPCLEQCAKFGKRFRIVRQGVPEAVLVSHVEWEQLMETLAALDDPKLLEQLAHSERDIQEGRVHRLEDAFNDLLGE